MLSALYYRSEYSPILSGDAVTRICSDLTLLSSSKYTFISIYIQHRYTVHSSRILTREMQTPFLPIFSCDTTLSSMLTCIVRRHVCLFVRFRVQILSNFQPVTRSYNTIVVASSTLRQNIIRSLMRNRVIYVQYFFLFSSYSHILFFYVQH